ncbi:putative Histone binding protein RBBP4 or subunit C of CAF1 complex [Trypanosoma vivax]|nr:putative Histone binding protein RBBP4 or subunit C of CAF1 complex [Trypanosoma vivax]
MNINAELDRGVGTTSPQQESSHSGGDTEDTVIPYQERKGFCTWRKHVRDLYQQLVHIDLVWESPAAQLMPYATSKAGLLTHTVLCCTRTGGQEQAYVQLISVSMPRSADSLDRSYDVYCDATGEVGGYGMAPSQAGIRVERRILHDGDPLTVRYMHANPLLIASGSSDGNVYVFDWSRISLNKFPNDPPRPRAGLPPNELSNNPTDEERVDYHKRMRALNAVIVEQDRWDARRGEGQHLLTLTGGKGSCETLDWCVTNDGTLASGSLGCICLWSVGNMSKDDPRTVAPIHRYTVEESSARVSEVCFSWTQPTTFVASMESGAVIHGDVRQRRLLPFTTLKDPAMSVSLSPLDGTSLLIGSTSGEVFYYDIRRNSDPIFTRRLHAGSVSSVQWCPHSRHLFSSGGGDAACCITNVTTDQVLFRHAGHTDSIMDLSWNWQAGCEGHLISVDSNSIMLWRPRDMFFVL